jgi:hypothetical protein
LAVSGPARAGLQISPAPHYYGVDGWPATDRAFGRIARKPAGDAAKQFLRTLNKDTRNEA